MLVISGSLIATLCVSATWFIATSDHHGLKRFRVVDPDRILRSGQLNPEALRYVLDHYHVKSILTLLQPIPDSQADDDEWALCHEYGVKIYRVGMFGSGMGSFEDLDRVADLIADPSNHPILVHCAAGMNRTGAAMVAYRVRHCGWDIEKALQECDQIGCSIRYKPKLIDHLRRYDDAHVQASPATSMSADEAVARPLTTNGG